LGTGGKICGGEMSAQIVTVRINRDEAAIRNYREVAFASRGNG
jgi:hypothetical protein